MIQGSAVLWSLLSVLAVSLVSLLGLLTLSMDEARLRRAATVAIAFAAGALLGDAFIHLIPETFSVEQSDGQRLESSLLILLGMVLFFIVEKLLRHQHGPLYQHFHGDSHEGHAHEKAHLALVNLIGGALHNFIDGVLIGASYLASPTLGLSTTVAVLLHEVPKELSDFGVLVHSGLSVKRAVALNLATASLAVVGTGCALGFGAVLEEATVQVALPITAGGFVYIAAADLIPELQHDKSVRAILWHSTLLVVGVAVMGALTLLE